MVGQTFGFAAQGVPEATVIAMNPPSIPGLGATGGLVCISLIKLVTVHSSYGGTC